LVGRRFISVKSGVSRSISALEALHNALYKFKMLLYFTDQPFLDLVSGSMLSC